MRRAGMVWYRQQSKVSMHIDACIVWKTENRDGDKQQLLVRAKKLMLSIFLVWYYYQYGMVVWYGTIPYIPYTYHTTTLLIFLHYCQLESDLRECRNALRLHYISMVQYGTTIICPSLVAALQPIHTRATRLVERVEGVRRIWPFNTVKGHI